MRNRYLLLIAIMLFTSVLANYLSYDTYHNAEAAIQAIQNIPLEMGKWRGNDIPLQDQIYEILETRSIIQRTYHSLTGQEVLLSIVHYPETKVGFHVPESCLGGQGIELAKVPKTITLGSDAEVVINLNQLIWRKDNSEHLVYYFYKAGEFHGNSFIKLRWNLAINKFSDNVKSGSLIRVSTPVPGGDTQKASNILVDFIEQLYPFLIKYL